MKLYLNHQEGWFSPWIHALQLQPKRLNEPKHAENTQETPWAAPWRDGASLLPCNHQTWRKLLILKGLVGWLFGWKILPPPQNQWWFMGWNGAKPISKAFLTCRETTELWHSQKLTAHPWRIVVGRLFSFLGPGYFQGRTVGFRGTQSLKPTSADFPTGMSFVLSKWIIAPI